MAAARESPEWSSRQLATWITDHLRLSVGGSTVYRLLKREGLVKPPDMKLLAGKEYQRKTSGPHQMWATDASYFRVVGWGYYYTIPKPTGNWTGTTRASSTRWTRSLMKCQVS